MEDNIRKDLAGKMQFREVRVDRAAVDTDARTVALAFSSEAPVERFYGMEVLSHKPGCVRMGRLMDGAPFLCQHDPDDQRGVIEQAAIGDDMVGRAIVRLSRSAAGTELLQDIADGIRTKISVGYMVHEMVLDHKEGDLSTYCITDWEPYEISSVSIPADNSVGVGRGSTPPTAQPQEVVMSDESKNTAPTEEDLKRLEAERKSEIEAIKAQYTGRVSEIDKLAADAIELRIPTDAFRGEVFTRIKDGRPLSTDSHIGMSEKEVSRFSLLKLINALANPTNRQMQEAAKLELEASDETIRKENRSRREGANCTIPPDVLYKATGRRDLVVGTASIGGNLVATQVQGQNFIDALRSRMVFSDLNAMFLSGLRDNIAIPRQSAATTAYWAGENTAPTEGAPTYDQVALTPKTVSAFVDYGRRLLIQSSVDVEALVQRDLATGLAVAIEAAAIAGTSTNTTQPLGLLYTSGIGATTGGTNGAAATWANILALESAVATANAEMGALAYLTNAKVRGALKAVVKSTAGVAGFVWGDDPLYPLNGYKAAVTTNVPSNLSKGTSTAVLSAILYGNFADLIIGLWGNGIDLLVDPYTGSSAGTVRVVAMADVDVAVRWAASFAAMKDAIA